MTTDARTDSNIATTNSKAAAYLTSSHNTLADAILAASYSRTEAVIIGKNLSVTSELAPSWYQI